MPVWMNDTARKGMRKLLASIRRKLPLGMRVRVWRGISRAVMHRHLSAGKQPLFRSIELETRTRCNSSCSFCAAAIQFDKRPDIRMPDETYDKILADLAALDYTGTLKFFVNNEPLLDPRTPEFIRKAKHQLPKAKTEVHTNGLKLNARNGRELLEAGLDLLVINNYSQNGVWHRGVQEFLKETAPEFPACDIQVHMRLLDQQLLNRGGTAPNSSALAHPLPLPCILPFDEMVVTADGRVTICCQDHNFDHAVGNVNAQSLAEIWFGEGFSKLRKSLEKGDRGGHDLCKGCDFRGYKEEHLTRRESIRNRMVGDLYTG